MKKQPKKLKAGSPPLDWIQSDSFVSSKALKLCKSKQKFPQNPNIGKTIRQFGTGATRDTVEGKLDYVKALSPIVLRRYVQYIEKHRLQSDGKMRDFDNWKKGIPSKTYHSSGGRHFFDAWLLTEGYATEDNHGLVELEDALCAQLFNIQGRLYEILKGKVARTKPEQFSLDVFCDECRANIIRAKKGEIVILCKKCRIPRVD